MEEALASAIIESGANGKMQEAEEGDGQGGMRVGSQAAWHLAQRMRIRMEEAIPPDKWNVVVEEQGGSVRGSSSSKASRWCWWCSRVGVRGVAMADHGACGSGVAVVWGRRVVRNGCHAW